MEYVPDEKDLLILEALRDRGDSTVRQIAKKTLLPATTIHNRIAKLRKAGVIKKFTIEVDPKKLGLDIGAYLLISADLKKRKSRTSLASELMRLKEIERVDTALGRAEIIVKLNAKGSEEMDRIGNKIQLMEGVSKSRVIIIK